MKVVCLMTGDKFGPEYPERLYRGLRRNATVPFDFEVRTKARFPGWWGKVEWFPPKERLVVLDLDVVITGNVDFLFEYDGPFCIWKDPYKPILSWNDRRPCYNSSVMSIAPGFGKEIREKFEAEPFRVMQKFYGDQEFISSRMSSEPDTWQKVSPGKVKSFKADKDLDGASIVVLHGYPKPSDLEQDYPLRRVWES